jgi:signal transduction histidine kinase
MVEVSRLAAWADRARLQQVVLNLVRNAVETTADMEGLGRRQCRQCSPMVTLRSRSPLLGVGIDLKSASGRFDVLHTKDGGLGLGLSISRKIISAHGGRLWAEQNRERGATFTFVVPLRQSASTAA